MRPRSMPQPLHDEALLIQSAETLQFRLGVPSLLAIAPDGCVLYSRTPPRSFAADLYELSPGGQERLLATAEALLAGGAETLSDAEKARRERTRTATRGILYAELSADGEVVLIPLGERVFLLARTSSQVRELQLGEGFPYDPRLSPDGTHVAFVRDGDVWVCDAVTPGATPRRLTSRPHPEIEYGTAELVAAEELRRTRGLWWAPDSRRVLFQRSDARAVDTLYVADARHPEKAPVPFKYPRPGRNNVVVDLGLVSLDGGEPSWISWDLARWPYLAQVQWPARGPLTLVVLDREQYEQAVLAVDPAAPSAAARVLLCERDEAWVNLPVGAPHWLDDGSGFLWLTEARGDWTLELHDAQGAHVRSLTEPELGARALVGLDGQGHAVLVASAAASPSAAPAEAAALAACEAHLWRVPLAGGPAAQLTHTAGVATGLLRHGVLVVSTARADGGAETLRITAAGEAHPVPSVREAPLLAPTTEISTVMVDGRAHVVALTRPRQAPPGQRFAVLLKVYGGPHVQYVTRARDGYVMDQWYADAGFCVVRVDARGTPHRGRAWERATLRDLISVPLADQIGALTALAAREPALDLTRVGVYGWSFGGYFSAMAALAHPELFKAAVAGAPVTDWALYDTGYTERYMKLPQANPEGYRATSLLTHAAALVRPLLLIHGTTDDNVHFAHTLALLEALYVAGKRAEVIALSGTHMVPDPRLALARERAHLEFFRQHLL